MDNFWVFAGSILQAAPAWIEALSVMAAAFAAIYGIRQWRKETIGKRRIEVAEQLRIAVDDAEYEIDQLRKRTVNNSYENVEKFMELIKIGKPDIENKEMLDKAYNAAHIAARQKQSEHAIKAVEHLRHVESTYRAFQGNESGSFHRSFSVQLNKVLNHLDLALNLILQDPNPEEINRDFYKDVIIPVIISTDDERDKIKTEIKEIVDRAQKELWPILRG